MATYVVGDIQGCLQPLQRLLDEVHFDPAVDVLWSAGDSVNRGPECLATLRFLRQLRDSLVMVLGNHDLHLLAVAAGARRPGAADTLDAILAASDRDELLAWLRHRPLLHREHGHTLVHAGIPPQWSLDEAAARAREVETALRSDASADFFAAMYGNEPATWSDGLSGTTRLRVITNYFTRMRYCTAGGRLDFANKGGDTAAYTTATGEHFAPWFLHPARKTAGEPILFGHWAALRGRSGRGDVIALDTGCVWDGALSLYHLDSGRWSRCECRQGRCRDTSP